jgi:hypothetical protein
MSRVLRIAAVALLAVLVGQIQAQSKTEKDAAVSRYKDKLVVVKKDGILMQLAGQELMCSNPVGHSVLNFIKDAEHIELINQFHCETEPIHKGEILKVLRVDIGGLRRGAKAAPGEKALWITVQNVSPHSITRGIGAFAHPSMELGAALVTFSVGKNANDYALADQWFTLIDGPNAADAARFGNTASGVFVNQVKTGMSFAEVEAALGVPQTRADLGEKVLYKYKDMTVEFHDGKVFDVR